METTKEKLLKTLASKKDIKEAIINKGVEVGDNLSEYADAINNISSLKVLLDATTRADNLFKSYKGESVENLIHYDDTSNVISMKQIFYGCSKLLSLPLLNTSNVLSMSESFSQCTELQTVPSFDTSKVEDTTNMFADCSKLTTIPQFNTVNVKDCKGMFSRCPKLQTIDLTSMSKATTNYLMCGDCYSLTKFIIREMDRLPPIASNTFENCYHFNGTVDATYNPEGLKDARIYVPDDKVEELKQATYWINYADIIVPLSSLVEE